MAVTKWRKLSAASADPIPIRTEVPPHASDGRPARDHHGVCDGFDRVADDECHRFPAAARIFGPPRERAPAAGPGAALGLEPHGRLRGQLHRGTAWAALALC